MKKFISMLFMAFTLALAFGQELTTEQLQFDGLNRTYLKYIPAGFDANSSLPLVMSFHGGASNSSDQLAIADLRSLADQDQFILLYPDAYPEPLAGETNWQVVVSGDLPFTEPTAHDDIGFVDALIDEMHAAHGIDLNRVYAMGYSNGGGFTFDLACRLNERIAAIGVVARTMYIESYEACNVTHPTAVMTILGTADYISEYNGIIYEGTEYYASAEDSHQLWIEANGLETAVSETAVPDISSNDGSTADLISWSSADNCIALEHYRINGGGHDWPGTFGNMDIVAHEVIWNFVKDYGLSGLLDCTTSSIAVNDDASKLKWSVYPNPTSDQLNISAPSSGPWHCTLFNARGQAIGQKTANQSIITIDCQSVAPGLHLLRASDGKGESFSSSVLIEH
tara:strand:+ start:1747 stop:2934 length:1188 start_codon:yes stop_codon:yes gene_type:complete